MCETSERTLAKMLVEIREALKAALEAAKNLEPKEGKNGTADARHA